MLLRWLLAALHLLALGIGLGAVWTRARALRAIQEPGAVRRALSADGWWGLAAGLWLGTGLWRLLAGTEKAPTYYFGNHLFWTKMALFALILLLEIAPMVGLVRWRRTLARHGTPDLGPAGRWAGISYLQAGLVAFMVLAATAMARGLGS